MKYNFFQRVRLAFSRHAVIAAATVVFSLIVFGALSGSLLHRGVPQEQAFGAALLCALIASVSLLTGSLIVAPAQLQWQGEELALVERCARPLAPTLTWHDVVLIVPAHCTRREIELIRQSMGQLPFIKSLSLVIDTDDARSRSGDFESEEWPNFWVPLLQTDGVWDAEKIKNEIHDFAFLIEQVPCVYDHVTGGRLSKHMYSWETVTSVADDVSNAEHRTYLVEDVWPLLRACHASLSVLDQVEYDPDTAKNMRTALGEFEGRFREEIGEFKSKLAFQA
jgi:hypothetical protein